MTVPRNVTPKGVLKPRAAGFAARPSGSSSEERHAEGRVLKLLYAAPTADHPVWTLRRDLPKGGLKCHVTTPADAQQRPRSRPRHVTTPYPRSGPPRQFVIVVHVLGSRCRRTGHHGGALLDDGCTSVGCHLAIPLVM